MASGGYDAVAEQLFSGADLDGLFLEYDAARSGGVAPLAHVPRGRRIVLGLVSSKTGALEDADALRRRIDEAAKYVPIDQLALSPQCGFASSLRGNLLSEDDQFRKIDVMLETAAKVWR